MDVLMINGHRQKIFVVIAAILALGAVLASFSCMSTPYGFSWFMLTACVVPYLILVFISRWRRDFKLRLWVTGLLTYGIVDIWTRFYVCHMSVSGVDVLALFILPLFFPFVFALGWLVSNIFDRIVSKNTPSSP